MQRKRESRLRGTKTAALFILLVLATLTLAGCALGPGMGNAPAEPTMTAIPLPTRAPTETAAASVVTGATSMPTALPPTTTPSPETAATTPPEPATAATETPVPPTPTVVPTATATPKPTRTKPRPTATPEFGGRLVFQSSIGGDIYVINADGTGLERITDGMDPVWSPDGKQIALVRWRDPRGVWVVNADGSGERHIFDWDQARWPSWSAGGEQILFSRQHGGQLEETERCYRGYCFTIPPRPHWKLGFVSPEDGSFNEPPSPDIAQAPDWAPGGDLFVYDGEFGLAIQSPDGQVSYPLTSDPSDTSPVWSPDGKRIAFVRHQHDHWEIYAMDADGRNLARLTQTPARPNGAPGHSTSPAWSPDGSSIAFLTDRSGRWEMWVMEASGSGQKPMFQSALDGITLEYAFQGERAISWTE